MSGNGGIMSLCSGLCGGQSWKVKLTISLLCPLIDIITLSVLPGLFFELCGSVLVGSWTRHIPRRNVHIHHLPSHRCLWGTTALWTNAENRKVIWKANKGRCCLIQREKKGYERRKYSGKIEKRRHRHLGFLNLFIPCLKSSGWRDTSVPDSNPDPHVFGPPGSGSGSASKNRKKTLLPTVLWLLLYFLFLKNDVNVPSKSRKTFFKISFMLASWRSMTKIAGSGFRIRIWIHTKMSWIRNTARYCRLDFHFHV